MIDNDVLQRQVLCDVLGANVRTHGATTVQAALTLWRSVRADLVLLDLGLDGGHRSRIRATLM